MSDLHPPIITSSEPREVLRRKRAAQISWRDLLWMAPLCAAVVAFPLLGGIVFSLVLGLFLVFDLKNEWRERRLWPHRFSWWRFAGTLSGAIGSGIGCVWGIIALIRMVIDAVV